MNKFDVVLCSVPKNDLLSPLLGIALISSVLKENNYSTKVFDFNVEYGKVFDKHFIDKTWGEIEDVFKFEDIFNSHREKIEPYLDEYVATILSCSPKFVGFSAFSDRNTFVIIEMAKKLKSKSPEIKIIIGGSRAKDIGQPLLENKIIDYYVNGEGENAILEILKGNVVTGVNDNSITSPVDMDSLPFSDYSDLNLADYHYNALYITGTRGCPRKCTFCEVPQIWGKFRTKQATRIADELAYYIDNYDTTHFYFTDSLINGSMKHFRDLCNNIIAKRKLGYDFTWNTFMMIRNKKQMSESDYDLLASSGCKHVKIGAESGSEAVRMHMKKGYIEEDLSFTLEQLSRVGMQCNLLLIVGYPTETRADFEDTKNMLLRYKQYTIDSTIQNIRIAPLKIVEDTELAYTVNELGISGTNASDWGNEIVSKKIRFERYTELRNYIKELGYTIISHKDKEMLSIVNKHLEEC